MACPLLPSLSNEAPLLLRMLCPAVLSLLAVWSCSGHNVRIATVPKEVRGKMQHLAYLQHQVDALFSAMALAQPYHVSVHSIAKKRFRL
jgi:hypothetical protein